eukprot:2688194-Rhodomonas_salina.1
MRMQRGCVDESPETEVCESVCRKKRRDGESKRARIAAGWTEAMRMLRGGAETEEQTASTDATDAGSSESGGRAGEGVGFGDGGRGGWAAPRTTPSLVRHTFLCFLFLSRTDRRCAATRRAQRSLRRW